MQKRRNSIALAMELRLSCTNPSTYPTTSVAMALSLGWMRFSFVTLRHELFIVRAFWLTDLRHRACRSLPAVGDDTKGAIEI